jgi:hypothetical protein
LSWLAIRIETNDTTIFVVIVVFVVQPGYGEQSGNPGPPREAAA